MGQVTLIASARGAIVEFREPGELSEGDTFVFSPDANPAGTVNGLAFGNNIREIDISPFDLTNAYSISTEEVFSLSITMTALQLAGFSSMQLAAGSQVTLSNGGEIEFIRDGFITQNDVTLQLSDESTSIDFNSSSYAFNNIEGGAGDDVITLRAPSVLRGNGGADRLTGSFFEDTLDGGAEGDVLNGGARDDILIGGSNVDTAIFAGNSSDYTITQTSLGVFEVIGSDGTDTLTTIEFAQFDDETIRLLRGTGVSVNFETADPSVYQAAMNAIRDFDGNALGGNGSWLRIGSADVNGDGDIDQILVNDAIGRFATVGTADDGLVYFDDNSWAGETRVAGIYLDPLVIEGVVEQGSPNDSQRRFQNDLEIENINRVLGADDYDGDGLQDVYFALTDGTAYLRAVMEADGNIRYANYQSEDQVIEFLNANGFGEETYGDWFDDGASSTTDPATSQQATAEVGTLRVPLGSGAVAIDPAINSLVQQAELINEFFG